MNKLQVGNVVYALAFDEASGEIVINKLRVIVISEDGYNITTECEETLTKWECNVDDICTTEKKAEKAKVKYLARQKRLLEVLEVTGRV